MKMADNEKKQNKQQVAVGVGRIGVGAQTAGQQTAASQQSDANRQNAAQMAYNAYEQVRNKVLGQGGSNAGTAGQNATTAGTGGGYTQNPYTAQAKALYEQLMNRGDFQYDMQGDMLYRQYADQYSQLGRQAMRDTMGTAVGLTGGYGNSYANTVGNQAYQQYLNQLNTMVPEFYDRAYQRWQDQGNELLTQYQLALEKAGSSGGYTSGATPVQATDTGTSQGWFDRLGDTVQYLLQSAGTVKPLEYDYYNEWLKKLQSEQ